MLIDLRDKNHLSIAFRYNQQTIEIIKQMPTRAFDKKTSTWVIPILDLFVLKKILKENSIDAEITEKAKFRYLEVAKEYGAIKDIAAKNDTDFQAKGLLDTAKLYPFQKVAVEFLKESKSGLLALDMGLGKSFCSIANFSTLLKEKQVKKCLLVCPAAMKYQWGYQIAKFSDLNYIVVSGSQKERKKLYKKNMNFIILNYELLWRDIEFIKDIEWDIIVADEIQRIRNYKSDTFKCFLELKSERRIGLTGTPIENELMDLFTIMRFINPKILGPNAMSFRDRYCTFDYFGRIDPKKYKNLDEINKKLSFIMMRRKKRDVLDQLPDKTINNIYITLNDVEKKKYKEIKEGILEDMESGVLKSVGALSQIIYLRQVCDALNLVDSSKKDEVVSSKFEELKNIIRDLPEDSKIVIFTQYERMAKLIEDNIGYKSVHLHGGVKSDCKFEKETEERIRVEHADMSVKDLDIKVYEEKKKCSCVGCPYYNDAKKCHTRKKIMAKFDNDKDIKLFISTDAGKAGLDLQKANILINYDLSFNPATNEQRIARIERMGQLSNKILIINMVCYDTIEERVMKIIEMKQKLFDKVIDGMTEEEVEKVVFNNASVKDLL